MENFSVKKLVGELLGTFALVLIGAGAAALGGGALEVALAFGLAFVVLVSVGGGQYNPAISVAMAIQKKISWIDFVVNSVVQIVGAVLAALVLSLVAGGNMSLGANSFGPLVVMHAGDQGKAAILALVVEVILTFFFVLTILRATRKSEEGEDNRLVPVVVGLALTALILVGFNLTGGSLNPARSLGPALLQDGATKALDMVWVFLVGPLVGGALAAVVDRVL